MTADAPLTMFVLAARDGDRDAFEHLAREMYDGLYALARRIVRDPSDAEDAAQEALLRAWRDLPHLREVERFEAWLTRLLVHACYDLLRRRRRNPNVPWILADANRAEPGPSLEERERLQHAFDRLTPEHRAVVALRFYRDLPAVEIASILRIPIGTVNSRLYYATRALRAAIEAFDRPRAREWTA